MNIKPCGTHPEETVYMLFMSIINWALTIRRPPLYCFTTFFTLKYCFHYSVYISWPINLYILNYLLHSCWTALVKYSSLPMLCLHLNSWAWFMKNTRQICKFITSDIKLTLSGPAASSISLTTSLFERSGFCPYHSTESIPVEVTNGLHVANLVLSSQ